MNETLVTFARPKLDPEMRPALSRMPDAVSFQAVAGRLRLVVRVTAAAVEHLLRLRRTAQWRDFDAAWTAIADAAELRIVRDEYDARPNARWGLPIVSLDRLVPDVPGLAAIGGQPSGSSRGNTDRKPRPP